MDLWRLKIFRNVIDQKGFSKAAKAINLSQPTISSHIKDLESHYGCPLIDRLGNKAVPTKAGELLYQYAGRLLTLHDEVETAMAEFQGKISGRLVLGGSTIPAGYILPQMIGKFMELNREVRISLVVADTERITRDVISGELELGVVGAKINDKRIVQEKLIEDEMQVIIPASHKWNGRKSIPLKALLLEPFIIRERGSGTLRSTQNSLAPRGMSYQEFNIVAEMGSTEAIIQGIKSNIGISVLSPISVANELEAGTMKALNIKGYSLKRNFYLTRHKDRSASPLRKAFTKFIKEQADNINNNMASSLG